MKKLLKTFTIISTFLILLITVLTLLIYSPINVDAYNEESISLNSLIEDSLRDVTLVNGGIVSIDYDNIEKLLSKKLQENEIDLPVKAKVIKLESSSKDYLNIKGYFNVKLFSKINFPLSVTIKTNIEFFDSYIKANVVGMKLSRIPLPHKTISNYISHKIDTKSISSNEFIKNIDVQNLKIELDYTHFTEKIESLGKIDNISVNDTGLSFNITPTNIIKDVLNKDLSPVINLISDKIDIIDKNISNSEQKKIVNKVKDIVSKIEENKIEDITAVEFKNVIDDIDNLDDRNKREIIKVFSDNINQNSQREIVDAFSNIVTKEQINELNKSFNR